jgi:hypothetical protein
MIRAATGYDANHKNPLRGFERLVANRNEVRRLVHGGHRVLPPERGPWANKNSLPEKISGEAL